MKYIALLRGINVGGNNIVKMADLKKCFEDMGFSKVKTVIASGNVFFETRGSAKTLVTRIGKELSKRFKYDAHVVILSEIELRNIIKSAPEGFGKEPTKYRYDVIFYGPSLTSKKVIAAIEVKEGVDTVHARARAVYFRRLVARITSSRINKIVGKPEYKFMTIRNWNTTTKLSALLEK